MTIPIGRARFPDDGDHLRALGCVAVCAAYLEDAIIKISKDLIYTFPTLKSPRDLQSFRLAPNARALRLAIDQQFNSCPVYLHKSDDRNLVNRILMTVEKIAIHRNEALHSRILQDSNGHIVREIDQKTKLLTSEEIYNLAEHLSILNEEIDILFFSLCRLRDYSPGAVHYQP